jgi:hypothetical protein
VCKRFCEVNGAHRVYVHIDAQNILSYFPRVFFDSTELAPKILSKIWRAIMRDRELLEAFANELLYFSIMV